MRSGFTNAKYNSRGTHIVDPTGASEKSIAEDYRNKADEVENEGYYKFAISLRKLVKSYDIEAQRNIDDNYFDE